MKINKKYHNFHHSNGIGFHKSISFIIGREYVFRRFFLHISLETDIK